MLQVVDPAWRKLMIETNLTQNDCEILLKEARLSLENLLKGKPLEPINLKEYPEVLRQNGASFVTLTKEGQLRGCIGALEPYQPLIEDVREHAIAAATQDYRFPPVKPEELASIHIEISRLTKPEPLNYDDPKELPLLLRPGVDGVVLVDGVRRATFLPQVWEKIQEPGAFLNHLCMKMGLPADRWKRKKMEVFIYRVEEFHE